MLFANKRGVSPLMATLLLILMSVGMGVAVMSWGEEYIEAKAEFVQGVQETVTTCDAVSFSVIFINGVQQMCVKNNAVWGLVDNGPDADIADFHARVVGESGIFVQEGMLDRQLPRASATPVSFALTDIGAVKQVKLTPKILVGGKQVICAKQAVQAENIRACP
jgi:hypothetical protein